MAVKRLRERNRAATQAAIERIAISLALKHGYDNGDTPAIFRSTTIFFKHQIYSAELASRPFAARSINQSTDLRAALAPKIGSLR